MSTRLSLSPPLSQINENQFKIGQIAFNKKSRKITFPARINILDSPLEYVVVLEQGRIHESLFTTDINPTHLNIALKLLRYKESKELFRIINEDFELTEKFHQETKETQAAARVKISVSYTDKSKKITHPLHQLILTLSNQTPLAKTPWIYSGSYVHEGKFKANLAGNIIAIFEDRGAIFNCPIEDRNGDRLWISNQKLLPPFNSPVTIVIEPYAPR